jgi:Zn-dependent metalloprotease
MSISKFRVGIRGALTLSIAVLAILNYYSSAVHSQGNAIPRSPLDPTMTAQDRILTEAETDAAFETAMGAAIGASAASAAQDPSGAAIKPMGVKSSKSEWTHKGARGVREKGVTKLRLSQVYKGIKVRGGHAAVHIADGQAQPEFARMEYIDGINVDINPKLAKKSAIALAKQLARKEVEKLGGPLRQAASGPDKKLAVAEPKVDDEDAVLEIHPGSRRGEARLAWHVSARDNGANGPVLMEVWLDQEGNVLEAYNNLQSGIFSGIGQTFYQGDRWITVDASSGGYVMNDNSLLIGVYDKFNGPVQGGTTWQAWSPNTIFGNNILGLATTDQRNTTNADTYATTSQTLSFMYWVLGRDFVDGSRGPRYYGSVDGTHTLITARNHVGSNYNNAFWDPAYKTINLGDGDGSLFSSFATLDIVGHEWTHGLTQYTAGLVYRNEPGAINESMSDIMGAMTERYWRGESANTWKIGEESYTPATAGDAMRLMNAPWTVGDPWHYSNRVYPDPCTPSIFNDNCGVHTNSSISNFAFYSLAKGWPGYVSAIGADKATQIFYKALRDCMISSDGFAWTRRCTVWAAGSLYGVGSFEQNQTTATWNFVGAPLSATSSFL